MSRLGVLKLLRSSQHWILTRKAGFLLGSILEIIAGWNVIVVTEVLMEIGSDFQGWRV